MNEGAIIINFGDNLGSRQGLSSEVEDRLLEAKSKLRFSSLFSAANSLFST
jgi:hypothetical protein